MKRLPLAALGLLLGLLSCAPVADSQPPTVSLDIAARTGTAQPLVDVTVTVQGEQVKDVTLQRDDSDNNVNNYVNLKTVTKAPFAFTYTDTLPGPGTYLYRVVTHSSTYEVMTDRKITFTVSAARP